MQPMSKKATVLMIVTAFIATIISLACGGGGIEGSSCKDPGARRTESSGSVYECLPIEPTRPQDGYVWRKVTTR